MKKIISKLALVGVAVAALFTSCVVEDIQTSFDLTDASCTVNVKVLYALDQSDVTSQATISHKYGSAATFTVPAVNKTVNAEDIAVTATFKGLTDTKTVKVATLLPGGAATYNVLFVFGSEGDISYEARLISETANKPETKYLFNTHYGHVGHDGTADEWNYNDSEFILTGTVNYETWSGSEIIDFAPADEPQVKAFVETLKKNDPLTKEAKSLDIKVSGWAAYQVEQTLESSTLVYDVYKKNTLLGTEEKIGSFSYKTFTGDIAKYNEKANPGHEGHYQHGHGQHDIHGEHNNAGGGIIFGE